MQYTLCVWHWPHGSVPYDVPEARDASVHWLDAPHCPLLVHGVRVWMATAHWHCCVRVLQAN